MGKVVERSLEVTEKSPKGRRSSFNSCPFRFKNLDQAHTSPCRCVPRATSAATRASQAFTVAKNEPRPYSTVMKKGDEGFRYQGQEEQGWARQRCSWIVCRDLVVSNSSSTLRCTSNQMTCKWVLEKLSSFVIRTGLIHSTSSVEST